MRPLLVLRPEPGNTETMARAAEAGSKAYCCPLFEIAPLAWQIPDIGQYDGLILTSANAAHYGGQLRQLGSLPLHCVGKRTAEAARLAGLSPQSVGEKDVEALLEGLMPQKLLHLGGVDVTAISSERHRIDHIPVYESRALPSPPDLARWIGERPVALLHSARAARRFAELAAHLGEYIAIAAISAKVAEAAGAGWEKVEFASNPRDEALITLALSLASKR